MTLTQIATDYMNKQRLAQQEANVGCDECPTCGETNSFSSYKKQGIFTKGIDSGWNRTWLAGADCNTKMRCDCYHCLTCGASWESKPYQDFS